MTTRWAVAQVDMLNSLTMNWSEPFSGFEKRQCALFGPYLLLERELKGRLHNIERRFITHRGNDFRVRVDSVQVCDSRTLSQARAAAAYYISTFKNTTIIPPIYLSNEEKKIKYAINPKLEIKNLIVSRFPYVRVILHQGELCFGVEVNQTYAYTIIQYHDFFVINMCLYIMIKYL